MRKLFLAFLGVILLGLQFAPMANADRCDATAITAPARSETVGGMVTIIGRANLSDSFVRYQVDFATAGKEDWLEINELAFAVLNDAVLARWDTNAISEGAYDLRVRAIDRTGNYCEQIVASVRVARNAARQELNGEPIRIPTLTGAFYVALPALPKIETCTHSWDVSAQVTQSIKLCAEEYYKPFEIIGDNIAIIGDDAQSAVVYTELGFAITAHGNNQIISGVHIIAQTLPSQANEWLCLYDLCYYRARLVKGGADYGGGILLRDGSNATIINSRIEGGASGIALLNRRADRIVANTFSDLTGWGIFAQNVAESFWIDNSFTRINRACVGPDAKWYENGCETAGVVLLNSNSNLIANNRCAATSNCFYLQGEGAFANNFNKLYGNRCLAPTQNCFEISYSQGIEMDYNVANLERGVTSGCALWLVYARVTLGTTNQFAPCDHRGSKLESSVEYVAGKP